MNLNWLASYPKSGNTWVRMLVSHYGAGEVRAEHHDVGDYWYQVVSPVPIGRLSLKEQTMLRGAAMAHLMCFLQVPTLVKTHHANITVDGLPLFSPLWSGKAVYIVRDPRDVVASFQAHMGLDTRDEAIAAMNRDGMVITQESRLSHILGPWSRHVRSWIENADPLVVRYEDLHADAGAELVRILEHLGFEPDPERVAAAVEMTRFDRLKGREQELPFPETSPKAGTFFRSGRVGGWREELTDDQAATVEAHHGEMMERLGYKLEHAAVAA